MLLHVSLFLLGLIVLVAGAEALTRGAVRVARALGISPFVIGFTLIGFGTSAPELVVCVAAALKGSPEIALGNVVGSNIANVGLVLGLAALIRPLTAHMRLLWVELPLVIGASLALWFLCRDNVLSRADGGVLLAGFAVLSVYMYRSARAEPPEVKAELGHVAAGRMRVWVAGVLVVAGLVGLVGGAQTMIEAAVEIARGFGVSEWLIGVTVVAVGTSLPEIAAALAAAYRGESDLVLGNVAGSNLFNILLILGVTVVVRPVTVSDRVATYELPVMVAFSLLFLAVLVGGLKVHRYEGVALLLAYAAFVTWQVRGA
jgi:cation:H+ antiporter